MSLEFDDRHVVVTGGTGALGSAVIEALLRAGATCHAGTNGSGPPRWPIWTTRRRSGSSTRRFPRCGLPSTSPGDSP